MEWNETAANTSHLDHCNGKIILAKNFVLAEKIPQEIWGVFHPI